MSPHRSDPDDREDASVPAGQVHVDGPPPLPLGGPPHLGAGPDAAAAGPTPAATPLGPRRRTRTAWLVGAGATCLVVIAVVLGLRSWDLGSQVSDLNDEKGTLAAKTLRSTATSPSSRRSGTRSGKSSRFLRSPLPTPTRPERTSSSSFPWRESARTPTAIRSTRNVIGFRLAGPPTATHSRRKVLQDHRPR